MRVIFVFIFFSLWSYGQISLGYDFRNNKIKNYDDGRMQRFKNSETIFIFSNFIEKKQIDEVLKSTWTVTPYKIISIDDFDINNYLNGNFSFATYQNNKVVFNRYKFEKSSLYDNNTNSSNGSPNTVNRSSPNKVSSNSTDKKTTTFNNNYFSFFLLDTEDYLNNIKDIKRIDNKFEVLSHSIIEISSFLLSDNFLVYFDYFDSPSTFMSDLKDFNDNIYSNFYKEDFLYDNKPGFLFNNFQNINNYILNETKVSPFNEIVTSQNILSLKNNILYIPYEVYCHYDIHVIYKNKNGFDKFKKNYDYQYEVLKTEEISNKILNGDDFYYLKFNLIETDKILQVVHSKTGEILYSKRFSGMIEQLPNKAIEDLNKEIKKSN
ncbi:hypothetical protein [Flavobacterium sp. HNIBRBA15423]|uniref:hypothetical protein n=1 Tax=Flavobacterium sp. HNIBRBA15423 TaxID=3458683 RepID=UPI004043C4C4